jgi:single-strand DNA-binding protein
MAGLNKVLLIGHLGGDPEIRRTADGRQVAQFSFATGEAWRDKATGERRERTEWHRVVIFNEAIVAIIEKFLKKGSKVYVDGQLATRKWKDQAGVERWTTEVVLTAFRSQLVMLDRAERAPAPDEDAYASAGRGAPARPLADEMNDEIPF